MRIKFEAHEKGWLEYQFSQFRFYNTPAEVVFGFRLLCGIMQLHDGRFVSVEGAVNPKEK